MVGTFVSVKKSISRYCFIEGADGKTYFCHQDYLKNKRHDWKFVWNGNECSFQIQENSDPNKKDIAVDVVPMPKVNPNKEKAKQIAIQNEINKEEKRKRKEHNILEQIKKKKIKDNWDAHCREHLYYVITYRKKGLGGKDDYKLVNPPIAFKDRLQADENLYFHKAENGDVFSYHLRRVVLYRVGGEYVVKELLPKNKFGKVLYQGRLTVYA